MDIIEQLLSMASIQGHVMVAGSPPHGETIDEQIFHQQTWHCERCEAVVWFAINNATEDIYRNCAASVCACNDNASCNPTEDTNRLALNKHMTEFLRSLSENV